MITLRWFFGTEQTAIGFAEINQLLFDGTYIIGLQGLKHYIDTAKNVLEKSQIEIKKIDNYCLRKHTSS